ncbi:MAG: diguanylate cyclase [Bacillota bacterium]
MFDGYKKYIVFVIFSSAAMLLAGVLTAVPILQADNGYQKDLISLLIIIISSSMFILSVYIAKKTSAAAPSNMQDSLSSEEQPPFRDNSPLPDVPPINLINVVNSMPVGVMVVDRDGRIELFNREAGEITERDPAEVVGKSMLEVFPNNYYSYTKEAIIMQKEFINLRNIIMAGDFFKELLFNISPVYDKGSVYGALATFQDVTPQSRMIEVQAAYSLSRDVLFHDDLNSIAQTTASAVAEMADVEHSVFFLADYNGNLVIRASSGVPVEVTEKYNKSPLNVSCPAIRDLYRGNNPVIHGDIKNRQIAEGLVFIPGTASFYSFPLVYEDRLAGMINLYSSEKNKLSRDRVNLMRTFCGQVNTAVNNFFELQKMRLLAKTDGLTGLYTKKHFLKLLKENTAAAKQEGRTLSLAIIDVDLLGEINDSYGHQTGDIVLREIASIIKEIARVTDFACRFGGEEFSIIMPGTSKDEGSAIIERIRSAIEKAVFNCSGGQRVSATISGGLSCFPEDTGDPDELITQCLEALKHSKRSGRNRLTLFTPSIIEE